MQSKRKAAFTLAEVLVTLAIIGVIAALTIPSLLNNINNSQHVAALQKSYSTLSQATQLIMKDNAGSVKGLCDSNPCLKDIFQNYMIGVKSCDVVGASGECWHKSNEWFYLNGKPAPGSYSYHSSLIGNDGSIIVFLNNDQNCSISMENISLPIVCGRIRVDTNGFKSPNTVGRDIFDFYLLENKIVPRGGENDSSICDSTNGWGCAAKVLSEGAMNY